MTLPGFPAYRRTPVLFSLMVFSTALLTGEPHAQSAGAETSAADRTSVHLTVYNNDLALVRDVRQVRLATGTAPLRFMDVAERILAESVHIQSQTHAAQLAVLEQNYEYDLLNPEKLLEKYVGQTITLVRRRMENNVEQRESVEAQLLSTNQGQVWRIGGQIVVNPDYHSFVFPRVPDNLIAHPTLIWMLDNRGPAEQRIEASYLTEGIGWKADYVLVLNDTEDAAGITGWVTLNNHSGTGYENAQLKLVAGDVRRVPQAQLKLAVSELAMAGPREAAFEQRAFFEYHLYTLQRPTTLKNNQSKQITLLEAEGVKTSKEYRLEGAEYLHQNIQRNIPPAQVSVHLSWANSRQNQLGVPLPAGVVRVYKRDRDGSQVFVGEDQIRHTPEEEKVTVQLGNAFDVAAERRQLHFQRLASDLWESEMEIVLRNHKAEAIVVTVNERLAGDWRVLQSSQEYEKMDAGTLRFQVPVAAKGEARLRYRVQIRA